MTTTSQHDLLKKLAQLWELSPDVRFGQLLANLGLLVADQTDRSLRDVENEEILKVMERHHADLMRRQAAEV